MGDEFVQRNFAKAELAAGEMSVLFDALSLALRAKTAGQAGREGRPDTKGVTLDVVDALRVKAEQLLDRGHPLRAAIFSFATMYDAHHFDPAAVVRMGEALHQAVDKFLNPSPPEQFRADIDG